VAAPASVLALSDWALWLLTALVLLAALHSRRRMG
jgi:hypothetical protein